MGNKINQTNVQINTYFQFMAAADAILLEVERDLKNNNANLKPDFKRRHQLLMKRIKAVKIIYDQLYDNEIAVLDSNNNDALRHDAYYFVRIALLANDRCNDDAIKQKHIETFIETMPGKGIVDAETISKYTMI